MGVNEFSALCRQNYCQRKLEFMNYEDSLEYLLSFADFERSGRFQERPDVAPVIGLFGRLGDPHIGRTTIHVAGSKGKGSVAALTESMMRATGRRTGLFTSPHLHAYTERIRIGGEPIAQADWARLVTEMQPAVEAEQKELGDRRFVTFDLLTVLGFLAFRDAGVDAQIVEVGLGGRVDSTNVFETKDVAVITPLSFEHTAVLGDTIEEIAAEKAAIITRGCTAVMAPQPYPEAAAVVQSFANRAGTKLVDVAAEYRWEVLSHDIGGQIVRIEGRSGTIEARLPLLGTFQAENAATAVAAVEALGSADLLMLVSGLEQVSWPGRLEVLRERPLVIGDGAHNRASARRLVESLRAYFGADRVTFIIGSSRDKDLTGLVEELRTLAERVYAVRSASPRAMEPSEIVAAFEGAGIPCKDVESVGTALERALAATDEGGLICLAGSIFVAAEGREYFERERV